MEQFIAVAEAAADAAGAVIRPLFRSSLMVEAKGDFSPVTEADKGAEKAIRALLAERLPDHGVIGEEYGADRPDAEWVWVLDPIDGTRAFITGRPLFGCLIALLHKGVPVLGVIDQPVTGERWIGVAGRPTTFRSPLGGKAQGRACPSLDQAELSCTSPDMFDAVTGPRFESLKKSVRRVTWGGDCYSYGLIALGLVDIVVDDTMKPWDWAALVPVIEGVGGSVTDWAGKPLRLDSAGDVLALGDKRLLPEASRLLLG
ncbi:histidinol-phosphatase [Acetobacteraceae bacterium H6797]|nr:histidinol-phosphatase [Acetobacteraceae bacterium H6797]